MIKYFPKLAANIITAPSVRTKNIKKDVYNSQRVLGTVAVISEKQGEKISDKQFITLNHVCH